MKRRRELNPLSYYVNVISTRNKNFQRKATKIPIYKYYENSLKLKGKFQHRGSISDITIRRILVLTLKITEKKKPKICRSLTRRKS